MTSAQADETKLIQMGEEAETLLGHEAFNSVVNNLVDLTFQGFVNTKPDEEKMRERHYSHYRALVDIVNTLQQRVSVKDEVLAKANDNTHQEEE